MNASTPIAHDLVFIGGGHSHAIALEQFAMNPLPGVRLTLITDVAHTPYSGMLPGYVAGLYDFDECHIDLWALCQMAGARLILDRAVGLDLAQQRVHCAQHPPIAFDLLSIDIGSTPSTHIEGAEHLIPVKPISKFLARWDALMARLTRHPQAMKLAIAGGGAGGIELAFSIEARLRRQPAPKGAEIHLFQRGTKILPNRAPLMRQRIRQQLRRRRITLHLGQEVTAIRPTEPKPTPQQDSPPGSLRIVTPQQALTCDAVFWVTGASAAPWLGQSGLETDAAGFITTNDGLQSSHPKAFAAGDVATMANYPRPKAGVFAVRQGLPLYENLRRSLLGEPLQPFRPQKQFLILVGTGDGEAIASRGPFVLGPSKRLWQWKDHIDRQFMARFLPDEAMAADASTLEGDLAAPQPMYCSGCGAKVGGATLSAALQRVQADLAQTAPSHEDSRIVLGLDAAEDAAVLQPPAGQLWVQTVDYFPALIDDPFRLGQITAHHGLNDLWAMGATPHSVLAIATLPHGTPAKQEELLYHLLSGVTAVLAEVGASLVGGHTIEGESLALGLTCNGTVAPEHLLKKSGLRAGQALILTKALGTGTLFAAAQQGQAKGRWLEGAIAAMIQSNGPAAGCLRRYGATACTDVTGFGLLGHLTEMTTATARQSDPVQVTLSLSNLPLLPGAADTLAQGRLSSLHPQNQAAAAQLRPPPEHLSPPYLALFDPQTAGGLLAAVPEANAEACLAALWELGYDHSTIVGRVQAASGGSTGPSPITIKM